jgi:protein phosphatase 2C family protein 2/3
MTQPFPVLVVSPIEVRLLTVFFVLPQCSETGEDDRLAFGLSTMHGWRVQMEDAHTAILDLKNTSEHKKTNVEQQPSFFSVFDGHNGKMTARFCAKNVHKILAKQPAFAIGDYEKALKDSFLATDKAILEDGIHNFPRLMGA